MVLYGNPVLYYYVLVVIDTTLYDSSTVQDYRTVRLGYVETENFRVLSFSLGAAVLA